MLPAEIAAIRGGVALAEQDGTVCVRVTGRGAAQTLDAVLARGMPVRRARAAPGLILRDDGRVFADVLVVGETDGVLILAEGTSDSALVELLRAHAPANASVESLADSHVLVTLEGPFAWELLGAWLGPDVVAAPFHTSFHAESCGALIVRAGKAGEYAYHVLVRREDEAELRARIAELAPRFELATIGRAARSLCALEQGSFDVGHGEARTLTPYELQLQWRLDYSRKVPGIAAVRALRDAGTAGRITWWIGAREVMPEIGSAVTLGQREVGRVIHAVESPVLAATIGLVLLDLGVAFPGLPMGWVDAAGQRQALQTVAPPLLNNRSLFVHPHRHTFAARERVTALPLRRVSFGTGDSK